ncbi:pentalenene oxygenase [Saccharothrix tamanrassetensis]|uniref:Pentalenene oxygenase n=1 Tax=Saccharothrix tamanrassetensis TaxID=1051531 RepID=A0A841C9H0_9PSEU|nr:cytochrome P450 [Saccharothrix tamanrassetensis]MBB5953583.1 pentalenene oxygenase [Saccharothrix tamanrassetensis]
MSHPVAPPIPVARGALPLVGHALSVLRGPAGFLSSLAEQGDLVRIALGPVKAVMVCDAELAHRVFVDDRTFDKGGPFVDRAREVVGNNLAFCPHADHRRQRRLLQPAFHPGRLPEYARTMSAQITERVDAWRDGDILDVYAQMTVLTTNVLTATMFSGTLTPAEVRRSQQDADALAEGVLSRMFMPDVLTRVPLPRNRRFRRARARMRQTVGAIVADRRAVGGDRGDLLSALLSAGDSESTGDARTLSDDEIVDQVMTFHLAGSETTATALSWALHLVAGHPDVERRLHAEVDAVLGGRIATYDDLPGLPFTGRIITETLRLYAPAWLLTRKVTADTELGDHVLPAGTVVVYSPYLIHHRADLYENPERFDPDRWDAARRPAPPRIAFLPFAGGARKCIGDRFSLVEATLALASIAARWRLAHVPREPAPRPAASAVIRPHRLRMRATRRTAG